MDQDVQIGSSVAIEEKKDENGKKLVSVRVRK